MAQSAKQRRPLPGRKVRQVNPVTFALSFVGIVFLLIIGLSLFKRVQTFRSLQESRDYLDQMQSEFSDLLGRDLFVAGMHRGACWEPPVTIRSGGRVLELRGSDGNFATALRSSVSKYSRYLQLISTDGLRPGLALRLCQENLSEEFFVESIYSARDKQPGMPESSISFSNAKTGRKTTEFNFGRGATVIGLKTVTYEFSRDKLTRIEGKKQRQTFPQIKDFSVRQTKTAPEEYQFKIVFVDPVSGLEKTYDYDWVPWYGDRSMLVEEAYEFYAESAAKESAGAKTTDK